MLSQHPSIQLNQKALTDFFTASTWKQRRRLTGTTVPTTNMHHISQKEDGIDGDEAVTAAVDGLLDKVGILKLGKDGMYFGRIFNDWPTHTEGISPIPSERELPLIQNVTIDIDRSLFHRYRRRRHHE